MLINFDYDGVLVDSLHYLLDIARRAKDKLGLHRELNADDLRTIRDLNLVEVGRLIGVSEERADQYAAEMYRLLRHDAAIPPVFAGIPQVMERLSKMHTVVIITANVRTVVERTLTYYGMAHSVQLVLDGEHPGSKEEKINASMATFGCNKESTFMVGDSFGDIMHGKRAGVKTVAACWGFQSREMLREAGPDYLAEEPLDLLEIWPSH